MLICAIGRAFPFGRSPSNGRSVQQAYGAGPEGVDKAREVLDGMREGRLGYIPDLPYVL